MQTRFSPALLLLFLAPALPAQTAESLDFLTGLSDFRDVRNMLPAYLNRLAMEKLDQRAKKVADIQTTRDLAQRQIYVRERMTAALGGFPAERTPLNARTVAVLDRDGYRVEKVIFESQPHFYVTANLYLPKTGQPPYPAILYPLGHEAGAKAHSAWQIMLITLARRGYVALAWDPVGQGERVQLYDADIDDSKVLRSTTEHSILGIQCLLAGDNIARYTVWDGLRALDYLLSRKEVDPARVACTGNSGGGTHTAYLSALDDRIKVAAPSCYITSWRRLLTTIGPQDAEQCIPPWLADGLDHGDFIYSFAPKPFLMLSAIRDFFSITGARETYEEVKRAYAAVGAEDRFNMFEADDGHGYTKPRRQAAYRWFSRWLKGTDDEQPEAAVEIESEETLFCTETGQVSTSLGGETVYSLNRKRVEQARANRPLSSELLSHVTQMIQYAPDGGPVGVRPFGTIARNGYRIEKLLYDSEPGIRLPALLYVPEGGGKRPGILYVHGRGKSAGATDLEELARAGAVVLAIDARGWGETQFRTDELGSDFQRFFGDYGSTMKALLLARPLVGMRVRDLNRALDLLAARPEADAQRLYGFGKEAGAVPLLYLAALDARLKKVALENMLVSYEAVVTSRIHRGVFESIVPGALKVYDLPDLVAALAPRPVWIVSPADPVGHRAPLREVDSQYAWPRQAFERAGVKARLHFGDRRVDQRLQPVYAGFVSEN